MRTVAVAAIHCNGVAQLARVGAGAPSHRFDLCHDSVMLVPRLLRRLTLDPRLHPRGQSHLSSASGLALAQGRWHLIADDEHHLASLDAASVGMADGPLHLLRLFEGDLPRGKGKRKDAKPDLETLASLPPLPGLPHGALLALGSGSRPTRQRAALIALSQPDMPVPLETNLAQIDLSMLYAPLRQQFADLNIEGAFVADDQLNLLQRGNKGDARNACSSFEWRQVAAWLSGQSGATPKPVKVQWIELGMMGGVPLGLTDASPLDDGAWAFSAVAEDTHSSYADGACTGSVIGVVGPDGTLLSLHHLQGAPKVEGIHAARQGNELLLTMVTDADNPDIASQMLQVRAPFPQPSEGCVAPCSSRQ